MTPEEARIGELARRETEEHLHRRRVLAMDELAELTDVRPRLEKEFNLPGDSRNRNRIYMFSIDGTLRGERITGCLFAGECIVVQASSFDKAFNVAKEGLRDTVDIAIQYYEEQNRLVIASPMDAVQVEAGGRRAANDPNAPALATDPKLKDMISHIIGGKSWRG